MRRGTRVIGDNTSADRFASRAEVTSLASFTYCALPCRIQLERVHVKSPSPQRSAAIDTSGAPGSATKKGIGATSDAATIAGTVVLLRCGTELPRKQQRKVLEMVQALVEQYKRKA